MDIRFSCDDGDKLDLKVAEILKKNGFKGIFYIAPYNQKVNILNVREIQEIAKDHEIGGHTLNHALLTRLNKEEAFKEVFNGKRELESLINKKLKYFAPPKGWFNEKIKTVVRDAGFIEMRTMKICQADISDYDKYEIPITAHLYPRQEYKEKGVIASIIEEFKKSKKTGYFHLVVHSQELQRFQRWNDFEKIVEYIKKNK